MTIDELKRALVEVRDICAERRECYGCPFEIDLPDRHICRLSPKLYTGILPEYWELDDWKEDSNEAR